MFATTTIPQQMINNHHLRTGRESTYIHPSRASASPHIQTKQGASLEYRRAHLLPIHNIPRPHLISKEPREVLRPRLELEPFLMFPPLVLSVEVAMPVLPLVVVLVFEEGVDRAAVD